MGQITIVCGHYGAGKTNLTVNLALAAAAGGQPTAVADLDIVNPYFRTADFAELLQARGIELIAPIYANSNLDLPVLPPRLASAVGQPGLQLFVDVGGDDDGAVALGGYAARIAESPYRMLYVINRCRYLEADPAEEIALLRRIEASARLTVTGLVNNTNLGGETTAALVEGSQAYLQTVADRTGLPVCYTTLPAKLCSTQQLPGLLPVDIYVKTPWQ